MTASSVCSVVIAAVVAAATEAGVNVSAAVPIVMRRFVCSGIAAVAVVMVKYG